MFQKLWKESCESHLTQWKAFRFDTMNGETRNSTAVGWISAKCIPRVKKKSAPKRARRRAHGPDLFSLLSLTYLLPFLFLPVFLFFWISLGYTDETRRLAHVCVYVCVCLSLTLSAPSKAVPPFLSPPLSTFHGSDRRGGVGNISEPMKQNSSVSL